MPTYRVTYRLLPAVRQLLEDVDADRYDQRGNWHVFAQVRLVVGRPQWICALRVHDREVASGGVALVAGRVNAACERREQG